MELHLIHRIAIAIALGLLVGLQREWATKDVAGIRTFPLITLFGTLSAYLAGPFGSWTLGAALLTVCAMVVVGNIGQLKKEPVDPGVTTEMAALVMFGVGALLAMDEMTAAVVVTGSVAVLLHSKAPLHRFAKTIGEADLRAVIRFVLIGLVILPILPNRSYGPYLVLNPFHIWLMVVLIVGISLAAYLVGRLLGPRVGSLIAGILGGLISSTATTASYSRRARQDSANVAPAVLVIVTASTVVFGRAIFEIALVAPGIVGRVAPPLLAFAALMAAITAIAFATTKGGQKVRPDAEPPSELMSAVVFGLLYAVVIFGVAVADAHLAPGSLYIVAALSGLTDMDAITLSTAQLVKADRLTPETGWRLIAVGAMANFAFKWGIVGIIGGRRLMSRIAVPFAFALVGGVVLLMMWPNSP